MSRKGEGALIGAGVAACAVCCAGPIVGVLAAIGLGTLAGVALFGSVGLVIAALAIIVVVKPRRVIACTADTETVEILQNR
ncbi:MAG: hypothetical protein ABI894_10805 [Ilumatobacteraceae bacterium]